MAQTVKNLPAMQETWVRSLGQEDPLEKGMATHSSVLAWRIPWTKEPDRLQSMGSQTVGHDWVTNTHAWLENTLLWIVFLISCPKTCYCCSVAQSCSTLCDPMDHSTPGFPVLYYLPRAASGNGQGGELSTPHDSWVADQPQGGQQQ